MNSNFVTIKTTELKENLYLYNTEAPSHSDYGNTDYIIANKGEKIQVAVEKFDDGRTYYTAFRKVNGVFYCYTHMIGADGKLNKNCGGTRASYEMTLIAHIFNL